MHRIFLAFSAIPFALACAPDAPKTGPATEKRFPPLKLPPGFKATLFACDPLVEYPSVIAIGRKPGAIFVAIDYMTGLGSDGKVKSEIRLVEDTDGDGYADKATVIATGFNSIQGLAYHDDTLFVMHAPYLTTLRIPSPPIPLPKGEGRKDILTGLGLKPEDNPSRLHCANGVVVGHDGWLYLAMGDNGINVLRPEGDRLIHNGGCILRCRPDGRDLHIFSTGLRNIYDIALDADLNVFTRDNENDGGTYMIRVLHSFFGADHGYPYDYEERPGHAMKPIGDFGLGSSAGGVCYLETQFPKEYRGNLFFCEWGKSVVRYDLKRSGSGFEPVKEIEFASGDPKDSYPFKPTDIVVQRDGTIMVADYADGQRPKRGRGRIYRIEYVGPHAKDDRKSAGYLDRCDFQADLEKRGRQAILDADKGLDAEMRLHLIWALARTEGAKAVDGLLRRAKDDADPRVCVQAIRAIADLTDPVLVKHKLDAGRGDIAIAKTLAALKNRDDPRVLLEIVIALGRLRWEGAPNWVRDNLGKPDAVLAHAAMHTLRRADNWPAVLKLLDAPDSTPIRDVALHAVVDQLNTTVIDGLIDRLKNAKEPLHRRQYAEALTRVYKKPGAWKYWGYRPGPRPANTEAWERTDAIELALDQFLSDSAKSQRTIVLKQMLREKVPVRAARLGAWLENDHDPERARTVIAALAQHSDGLRYLEPIVFDKKHSVANRLQALTLLPKSTNLIAVADKLEDGPVLAEVMRRAGKPLEKKGPGGSGRDAPASFFARRLESSDPEVRAAAIEGLGDLQAKEGHEAALRLLKDGDVRVRRAAAAAAGKLGAKNAGDLLLKLLDESDPQLRGHCFDSLAALRDARAIPRAVAALQQRDVDIRALDYLFVQGGPGQIGAVVAFAKQNPASDVAPHVVGVLLNWRDSLPLKKGDRDAIENAIAIVHGDTGVFGRWFVHDGVSVQKLAKVVEELDAERIRGWSWTSTSGAESRLRLTSADFPKKDTVWLAATELFVPVDLPVEFLASSRGSLQVWVNGKPAYRRDQTRKFELDSDRFSATLVKGMNRVLVATGSGNGDVEFHLRFRRKSNKAAHEKLTQAALSRTGNAERGRKMFFDKEKSQCLKCHQLGNQGERIGPDLSGVGARFSRVYLIESILDPSRAIAPSFGTIVVTLKNGKILNGVKVAEDEQSITLADNQGQKSTIAKRDIDEQSVSAVSTMPEGLEAKLTEDEFVDLIAFLQSQDGRKVAVKRGE